MKYPDLTGATSATCATNINDPEHDSDSAVNLKNSIDVFYDGLYNIVTKKINDQTHCLNFKVILDSVKKDMVDYVNTSNTINFQTLYEKLSDAEKYELKGYIKYRKDTLTEMIQLKQFNCRLETYTPPLSPDLGRKYDQVVKGDVSILRINKNSYKITFDKIGKFLLYQIWNEKGVETYTYMPDYPSSNDHPRNYSDATKYADENADKVKKVDMKINNYRYILRKNAKKWVEYFNALNSRKNFTPTTVMQISNKKYVFVIKKAKINKKGELVFYVTTKEINIINDSKSDKVKKIFKKLPIGKYQNVRFDIDYSQDGACDSYGSSSCECWCPNNTYVSGIASTLDFYCQQNTCNTNYDSSGDICYYCPPGFIEDGGPSATRELWGVLCCWVTDGLPLTDPPCVMPSSTEDKEDYLWANTGSDGGAICCTNTSNVTTCTEPIGDASSATCTTSQSYCDPS